MLARLVYWFVGYVLWTIRGWQGVEWDEGDHTAEAWWWIFSEYSDTQYDTCTRAVGPLCVRAWKHDGACVLTRWAGRKVRFAYRQSYGSGKRSIRYFIHMYGVAHRLGL